MKTFRIIGNIFHEIGVFVRTVASLMVIGAVVMVVLYANNIIALPPEVQQYTYLFSIWTEIMGSTMDMLSGN